MTSVRVPRRKCRARWPGPPRQRSCGDIDSMSGKQKKPVQIHSVPFKSVQFTGAIIPYTETMCPVTTTMRTQKKVRNSMEGVPRRGTTAVDVEKMKASDRAARVAQAPQQHRRLCSRATPREPTFTCLVRIRYCRSDGHPPLPRIAQTKQTKTKKSNLPNQPKKRQR